MTLQTSVDVPGCKGVDHMDFSADGRYLIASCEFAGAVIKFDVATQTMVGKPLGLGLGLMPQVADMMANGVHMIDGNTFTKIGFLPTGKGAHGLYVSRDSKTMYVSNRGEGTISLVDLATRKVSTTWKIPNGGSPDAPVVVLGCVGLSSRAASAAALLAHGSVDR